MWAIRNNQQNRVIFPTLLVELSLGGFLHRLVVGLRKLIKRSLRKIFKKFSTPKIPFWFLRGVVPTNLFAFEPVRVIILFSINILGGFFHWTFSCPFSEFFILLWHFHALLFTIKLRFCNFPQPRVISGEEHKLLHTPMVYITHLPYGLSRECHAFKHFRRQR